MKKPPNDLYFLYRTNPFRPLYYGRTGFHEPPSRTERSARRRNAFVLWTFRDKAIAQRLAHLNRCEWGVLTPAPPQPPPPAPKPARPKSSIEDLI